MASGHLKDQWRCEMKRRIKRELKLAILELQEPWARAQLREWLKREGRSKRVRLATDLILLYVAAPRESVAGRP